MSISNKKQKLTISIDKAVYDGLHAKIMANQLVSITKDRIKKDRHAFASRNGRGRASCKSAAWHSLIKT